MKKFSRLCKTFLCGITGLSMVCTAGLNVQAEDDMTEGKYINLPVEIIDMNQDNLFFEYPLSSAGMQFLGGKGNATDAGEVTYQTGLVEDTLVNGLPVYKQETVENTARNIRSLLDRKANGENLTGSDAAFVEELSTKLVNNEQKKYEDVFKNMSNPPFGTSDEEWSVGDGRTYSSGNPAVSGTVLWEHDNDCVKTSGTTSVLQKTVILEAGTYKLIKKWNPDGCGELYYQIGQSGEETVFNANDTFTIGEDSEIIFKIKGSGIAGRIGAFELSDGTETRVLLGNTTFYEDGWQVIDGEDIHYSNGMAYQGDISIWRQDSDAIEHSGASSSISRIFDVTDWKELQISFVQGWSYNARILVEGVNEDNSTVLLKEYQTVTKKNDQLLEGSMTEDQVAEQFDDVLNINAYKKVKVTISTVNEEKLRVAGFTLKNTRCTLGSYAESKMKFDTLNHAVTLEDFETCMDYSYYMLNHLYDSENILANPEGIGKYDNLYLKKAEDSEDTIVGYVFDSDLPVQYEGRTISNATEGAAGGFFPLDSIDEDDGERIEGHNFHFTMKASGQFEYHEADNLFFDFSGDDDVYLFVNSTLTLDLGGAHLPASRIVYINELIENGAIRNADGSPIEDGDVLDFDLFYMERHSTASNLKIHTNIMVEKKVEAAEYRKVIVKWNDSENQFETRPDVISVQIYEKDENGEWVQYSETAYPLYAQNGESQEHTFALPSGKEYQFRIYGIPDGYSTDGEKEDNYYVIKEIQNTSDELAGVYQIVNSMDPENPDPDDPITDLENPNPENPQNPQNPIPENPQNPQNPQTSGSKDSQTSQKLKAEKPSDKPAAKALATSDDTQIFRYVIVGLISLAVAGYVSLKIRRVHGKK